LERFFWCVRSALYVFPSKGPGAATTLEPGACIAGTSNGGARKRYGIGTSVSESIWNKWYKDGLSSAPESAAGEVL